jgi:hypothetical protein
MNRLSLRKRHIIRQLMSCKDMVRGSLNSVCARCKRGNCACENPGRALIFRLTYKDVEQRTRIVYVPRDRVSEVKGLVRNYRHFCHLMEELIEINVRIFKSDGKG